MGQVFRSLGGIERAVDIEGLRKACAMQLWVKWAGSPGIGLQYDTVVVSFLDVRIHALSLPDGEEDIHIRELLIQRDQTLTTAATMCKGTAWCAEMRKTLQVPVRIPKKHCWLTGLDCLTSLVFSQDRALFNQANWSCRDMEPDPTPDP